MLRRILTLLCVLIASVALAQERGIDALERGAWEQALDDTSPARDDEMRLRRAEALWALGRYDDALTALRDARSLDARARLGRRLIELDRIDDALEVLDPLIEEERAPSLEARIARADAYRRTGRRSRAALEYEDVLRQHQRGSARGPEALRWVAEAAWRLDRIEEANTRFREALDAAPDSVDVRLAWARLFLAKYRPDDARGLIDEALERNPRHPDALALLAETEFTLRYDRASAEGAIERALAVDPKHAESRELRARMAMDDREFARATEVLDALREDFPQRLSTMSLQAAVAELRDDQARFDELEREVLRIDPLHAELYQIVGEAAVRHFRYVEGLAFFEQALELDASHAPTIVALGIAYSRVGDDARAVRFLQRAFERDPFNVSAYNMANLWESTLEDYRFFDDEEVDGLRYRFHRDEAETLLSYIPPVMRDAWARYVERYEFTPEPPVSIEVFRDRETFSVRSVGLPHAGQHGICFGHVITARSPSERNFNWHMVLAHELSHVFSLQASAYRVPRWFTEGLAEYDTMLTRPEWYREHDPALARALRGDALLGVMDLDGAFTDVERPTQILEAYYQASLVVAFIGERWGYEAIRGMLAAYADSLDTPEALERTLGLDVAAFDAAFEEHLRQRLHGMLAWVDPDPAAYSDLEVFEEAAEHDNDESRRHAELALARLNGGNLSGARASLDEALRLDPTDGVALWTAAIIALQDDGDAEALLRRFFDAGHESVTLRLALAEVLERQGAEREALGQARRATELDVRDVEAWRRVASLEARVDGRVSAGTLEQIVRLDEHDAASALELAQRLEQAGQLERAFEAARQASDVDPFDSAIHLVYGRLAHRLRAWPVARRELERALAAGEGDRNAVLRLLIDVYEATGASEDAERTRRQLSE